MQEMLNKDIVKSNRYDIITVKIDGESVIANIMSKDEFVRTFFELKTLIKSDNEQYWVLYEEHGIGTEAYCETYWCMPSAEVDFIYDEDGWQIVHDGFEQTTWTVKCNGYEYSAIGYENRGIFGAPIACIIGDACISCTVYEIIKGFKKVTANDNISASRLNSTEIELLETVGCKWTGCFITKA